MIDTLLDQPQCPALIGMYPRICTQAPRQYRSYVVADLSFAVLSRKLCWWYPVLSKQSLCFVLFVSPVHLSACNKAPLDSLQNL
jgi:hypothetical protein